MLSIKRLDLTDARKLIRGAAAKALGVIGNKGAVEPLLDALKAAETQN